MMNANSNNAFGFDSKEGSDRKVPNDSSTLDVYGDPILVAIDNLRVGFADYNANAPAGAIEANDYAERSYRPPHRVIEAWDQPARSRRGAIAALRLAKDADNDDDHALVGPMIEAALSYFDENV